MNALGRGDSEREEGEPGHLLELIRGDAWSFQGSLMNLWLKAWHLDTSTVFGRLFVLTN